MGKMGTFIYDNPLKVIVVVLALLVFLFHMYHRSKWILLLRGLCMMMILYF